MFTADNIIIICICLISLLMATFPTVTLGNKVLIDIRLPEKINRLCSVFRSTGRLIWPMWYLIMLYSIKGITILKYSKKCIVNVCILVICLIIQIVDISSALISRHETFANEQKYEYSDADFWQRLSEYRNFKCVCFTYQAEGTYMQVGALALKYNWMMNSFYFARDIEGIRQNQDVLSHEGPKSDCIYVFYPNQQELMESMEDVIRYYNMGEFIVGITWLDDDGNVNDFSYE